MHLQPGVLVQCTQEENKSSEDCRRSIVFCHVCMLSGNTIADPLCWHGATRARVAQEYLLATEAGLKAMYKYTFPFIVFHGADDTLTDPDGSQQLFERSKVRYCADSLARFSTMWTSPVCWNNITGRITHEGGVEASDVAMIDTRQRYVEWGCAATDHAETPATLELSAEATWPCEAWHVAYS